MRHIKIFYIIFFSGFFSGSLSAQTITVKQYIEMYKDVAMKEMIESRIPASITLAQGLLESGSGNSRLATTGNNHFGIKCKKDWTGCTILEDDDALQECFRCYTSGEESYKDHSRFLRDNKRYASLFTLEITNYEGWAAGLLAAGYATNRKYTDLLITCIEKNQLGKYDTLVVNGYNPYGQHLSANIEVMNAKNVPLTVVQPNQTLGSIAEQNSKTEKKLAKYNDLEHHHIEPGDVIYLKPKKRKACVATHTVMEGESMWLISQKYAIKLQSLYNKNLMDKGTEALPGSVLQLQHKAQVMPDTGRLVKESPAVKKPEGKDQNTNAVDGSITYHIVSAGETLYGISKIYNIPVEEIIAINHLAGNNISIGQKLKVAGSKQSVEVKPKAVSHIVKSGETLYSISKLYHVGVDSIRKLNNLNSDSLTIGQVLVVQ